MSLYLIKRGESQIQRNKSIFHPFIVCANRRVAIWEAGATIDGAWVWSSLEYGSGGWMLNRWKGLDIDYGYSGIKFDLPDGTPASIWRDYENTREPSVRDMLNGAIWWSEKKMPLHVVALSVKYPVDHHTQQSILDVVANDGSWNSQRRKIPDWWKEGA